MKPSIEGFLATRDMTTSDITHYITHPGGAKVMDAYQQSLALDDDKLKHTADTLRCFGNMSACSVLFVFKQLIDQLAVTDHGNEYGLVSALGPGFSAEMVLVLV
jgi:alkylresorcinol/alkylpyrone synthase